MEKNISEQGNARTFCRSQDAKLMYQSQDLNIFQYLIEGNELKIGRFTIKAIDDKLYILLDDEIIFKLTKTRLMVKRIGNQLISIGGVK